MTVATQVLTLPDGEALADLRTLVGRAGRVDPDGAVRLIAQGEVLAAYVSPLHGSGGPTVLGLRALRLANTQAMDLTMSLTVLADRLGEGGRPQQGQPVELALPVTEMAAVAWAGVSPPRTGWQSVLAVPVGVLRQAATVGTAEVTAGTQPMTPVVTVARLRARVWGRPLLPDQPAAVGLPAGVAYAAQVLGFLPAPIVAGQEPSAPVHRCGSWWRVTCSQGYLLARLPALGGS